ncbi:MAG TPA: hypothetical protein VN372_03715 [Methanospirillum sp.]|nr:hypothetical protein [Methanospirillum sp.]
MAFFERSLSGKRKHWATATGGVITEVGGYRIHTFYESGTFEVKNGTLPVEYLIVGAGGGAGRPSPGANRGGCGGAGGVRTGKLEIPVGVLPVAVGIGGTPGNGASITATNGGKSSLGSLSSEGGGAGGQYDAPGVNGGSGGGGGGYVGVLPGGAGISEQGYTGGAGGDSNRTGGAGGSAGGPAVTTTPGPGITTSISGVLTTYAVGGSSGTPTTNNSGNGGNSISTQYADVYPGCSGIVIMRYQI